MSSADRNQRLANSLFKDAREHKWKEAEKAEAHRQGIRNDREANEYAERGWLAKGKPYVENHPTASTEKVMAYRAAIKRPRQSEEEIKKRNEDFLNMRHMLSDPPGARKMDCRALDAEQRADPVEGPALQNTGLAGDAWYAHLALREKREREGK